ncbi:hypothetical protein CALCODRAFT_319568 [Calocera cornea HHB12733]|uniref:Uncharacterized protein n=1 Tax=Calocera cornea HHB12733 TaxID=1353952 RepID=A0A165F7J2_9BASI|nr:hypothetical protein CALCODRAFT_319568 [Calocera cornea HHB12733]
MRSRGLGKRVAGLTRDEGANRWARRARNKGRDTYSGHSDTVIRLLLMKLQCFGANQIVHGPSGALVCDGAGTEGCGCTWKREGFCGGEARLWPGRGREAISSSPHRAAPLPVLPSATVLASFNPHSCINSLRPSHFLCHYLQRPPFALLDCYYSDSFTSTVSSTTAHR